MASPPADPGRSIDPRSDGPEAPGYDPDATTIQVFHTLAAAKQEGRFQAQELQKGQWIAHYQILDSLGTGGVSAVYSARHRYLNQEVALKTLRGDATGPEFNERFLREAQALAVLANPHVIRVYDAGMWNEVMPYIILEKISGKDVRAMVAGRGPFSVGRAMDLLEEIGRVLILQEEMGILHRDIKPANILQRKDGSFCLLDYGLVGRGTNREKDGQALSSWEAVTEAGTVFGTPSYMAPEQFGGQADHRTDLYLLGMTAWECLAGRPARAAKSSDIPEIWNLSREPVSPVRSLREDMPEPLDHILAGLLAVDPAERYQSATEFLHDLESFRYQGQQPLGSTRGDVFVAMSYAAEFGETYRAIERACRETRLRARRMDQLVFVKDIWNQIVQEIEACAVLVADFSVAPGERWPNPNVITEAAHARAIGKALIIMSRDPPEQLPFDWRHIPVLRYSSDPATLDQLSEQLTGKLRYAMLGSAH